MRVSLQAVSCISTTVKPAQLFSEASTRQRVQIPFMIRSSQAFVLTLEEKKKKPNKQKHRTETQQGPSLN